MDLYWPKMGTRIRVRIETNADPQQSVIMSKSTFEIFILAPDEETLSADS